MKFSSMRSKKRLGGSMGMSFSPLRRREASSSWNREKRLSTIHVTCRKRTSMWYSV